MSMFSLLVSIVPHDKDEKLTEAAVKAGCGGGTVLMGRGLAQSNIAAVFGLGETTKDLIYMVVDEGQKEFKVIADHARSLTFALSDGATFENYGRGYVLRRLLRRASRNGRKLNINHTFMASLVDIVIDNYRDTYPELEQNRILIKKLVTKEEELFQKTLLQGEKILDEIFASSTDHTISGEDAFKLYDTYGYPIELTEECAMEKGFIVDNAGFIKHMELQKELARRNRKVESSMNIQNELLLNLITPTLNLFNCDSSIPSYLALIISHFSNLFKFNFSPKI